MGYALVIVSGDRPAVIECGIVAVPSGAAAALRLLAIADALDTLIRRHRPVALALERLYFNRNARTAMSVAEARGIALLCAARAGLQIAEYTPQEVKLSVTGDGGADKRGVQRMLPHLVAMGAAITQDNVADAIAIALTHAQRARLTEAVALAR
ncbi:MAG: crossover junction endodeoxyribonuclease RuvC [Chloroflexi bacterium]|nr:MAG: crossover junction endodeoxyribonuclease RuvC [Chloroflexota bacterium]